MGQFSFTDAEDPNRSIVQAGSEHPDGELTSYFLMPDGSKLEEPCYGGFGHFDDVDAYEWLSEVNELAGGRDEACDLHALDSDDPEREKLKFLIKITYNPDVTYLDVGESLPCPHQGLPYRPDKAIAAAAGAPEELLDEEALEGFDFSDPRVILGTKLLYVFSTEIPDLGNIDPEELENDKDRRNVLLDFLMDSAAFNTLRKQTPNLPNKDALGTFVEMLVSDTYHNGFSFSEDGLNEALVHIDAMPELANTPEPDTPETPTFRRR